MLKPISSSMKKYIISISLFLGVSFGLTAQSILKDIESAANAYRALVNYQGSVVTKAFDLKGILVPESSNTTVIFKKGKKYRYEFGKSVVIIQPDKAMLLDKTSKTIALSKPNDYTLSADKSLEMLKSWIKNGILFKFIGLKNGLNVYLAESNDLEFYKIELAFNTKNKLIAHLHVWYNSEYNEDYSRIEYTYTQHHGGAELSEELFDLSNFIQTTPQGFKPVKAYSNFQLVTD
jgi:hypothetical protein